MKAIKYFMLGALTMGVSTAVMAQDDKAIVESIAKVIKEKPADLEDQVKAVYKKNKKNAAVLVGIGRAFYDANDTANAVVYADYAIKANSSSSEAYILKGDIAALGNDGGAAALMYQNAIHFDPKNASAYYKYANVYRKISPSEAVSQLENLRAHRPDIAVDAWKGRIYYSSNEFAKAIDCYSKADRNLLEERDITEYAMSLFFTGKNKESLEIAKFGLTKSPRDAAFNRLAFFNSTDLKDYESAFIYADALFNKSDSAKLSYFDYTYYGNAYSGAKQPDKAIEMYKKALTMDIDNKDKRAGVIKQLAEAYSGVEDYENAITTYKQYFETVETPSVNDYPSLAQIYVQAASKQTGEQMIANLVAAEKVYDDMVAKFADSEEYAIFQKARINSYKDPETSEGLAKPFYEKLAGMIEARAEKTAADKARLIESYRYLGYYYLVKNDKAASVSYWTKLLEIDPTNEQAKQAMQALSK